MSSKVYFTDFRCKGSDNRLAKLERLVKAAGIEQIDFQDKYVAIKVHFGEWGNLAFLRQQYAKVICDLIKSKGGKPFLTDCNTLYPGYRHNALDHLDCAYMNGYNPLATGVHTIIADGLRGTDERLIPVAGGEYVKEAKIGAAVAEADVIISITHFKGHVSAGYGGCLKNLGMGCGSKKGKMEMHSEGAPAVNTELCIGCGMCVKNCQNDGVHVIDGKAVMDPDKCLGCGHCMSFCPKGALDCQWDIAKPVLSMKIAEYCKAVVDGKPAFHISFVADVSPDCDCDPGNDVAMIPDVGIFASFDPVAIDQACVDAVNDQPFVEKSMAGEKYRKLMQQLMDSAMPPQQNKPELFRMVHPNTDWEAGLAHAERLGMGTREYELVKL